MALTLAQLKTAESIDDIRDRLLTNLEAAGMPVDDWVPSAQGGVEMIRVDTVATAMQRLLAERVARLANLMLLELATGDDLELLALKRYGIVKDQATKTIQSIALWLVGTSSAKTHQPGDIIAGASATGNRYTLLDEVEVLPANTLANPVFTRAEAENAGVAYDDAEETVDTMVSAIAGLRCTNRRPSDFLPATNSGSSSGTIDASFTTDNVAPTFTALRVRIIVSGELGTATFEYSTDGGATWTYAGAVSSLFVVPGGATLVFANGTAPSFIVGDVFTMLVGEAILQRGADAETDESLRKRCRLRWMTLSKVPLAGTIDLWAHLASPEVDRVLSDADPNVPGSVLVTISAVGGPASAAAVIAVQDYVSARLWGYKNLPAAAGFHSPEETVIVSSAAPLSIRVGGAVTVPRARVAEIQAAAETAWLAYLRSVPLGGDFGAVVRINELVQAVMDAGAIDFQDPTLNDGTDNITLAHGEVAIPQAASTLTGSLVWVPV